MLRRPAARLVRRSAAIAAADGPNSQLSGTAYSAAPLRSFLNLRQFINKEDIEKEKARLSDEMSRGYFADINEIGKHGGKIAFANKTMIPTVAAVKFPDVVVNFAHGRTLNLPVTSGGHNDNDDVATHAASLICLSFRASSQIMTASWSLPFVQTFGSSGKIGIYEVLFVDSWFLSLYPVKHALMKVTKKSCDPQIQRVFAFGDHYDLRKKLQIQNLLTGYMFLLDGFGRIRWQGFGSATEEELLSLFSCATLLLDE